VPAQSRRQFVQGSLALMGVGLAGGCGLRLPWQQPKVPRIGYLDAGTGSGVQALEVFRDGMRGFGYVEGRTLVIEYRNAEGVLEGETRAKAARGSHHAGSRTWHWAWRCSTTRANSLADCCMH
jgi:hypothetical protein